MKSAIRLLALACVAGLGCGPGEPRPVTLATAPEPPPAASPSGSPHGVPTPAIAPAVHGSSASRAPAPAPTSAMEYAAGWGRCATTPAESIPCAPRAALPDGGTQTSFSVVSGQLDDMGASSVERIRRGVKNCLVAERAAGRCYANQTVCVALRVDTAGRVDETAIQFPEGTADTLRACADEAARKPTFTPAAAPAIVTFHVPLALMRGDLPP